jgi:hypothetical protein
MIGRVVIACVMLMSWYHLVLTRHCNVPVKMKEI